jgi:hypothetical protein
MKSLILITLLFSFGHPEPVKYRKITWEDFKGVPDSTSLSQGHTANIQTQWTMVDSIINERCYFSVENDIVQQNSWACNHMSELLQHEQIHVSISAIVCHEFQMELKKYQGIRESKRSVVINLFNAWWKKERLRQALYDNQTKHGSNRSEQARWEKYINEQLKP